MYGRILGGSCFWLICLDQILIWPDSFGNEINPCNEELAVFGKFMSVYTLIIVVHL
jgi:hypothetical protein